MWRRRSAYNLVQLRYESCYRQSCTVDTSRCLCVIEEVVASDAPHNIQKQAQQQVCRSILKTIVLSEARLLTMVGIRKPFEKMSRPTP